MSELPELVEMPMSEVRKALPYLRQASLFGGYSTDLEAPDAYLLLSEQLIRYRSFADILAQHEEWASRHSRERKAAMKRSLAQPADALVAQQGTREIKELPVKERTREVRTPLERYTLIKQVGQGGAGFVVAARNEAGVSVALKYLGTGRTSQTVQRRFRNEIRFGLTMRHPNIVPILDVGEADFGDGVTLFYVMPLYPLTLRLAMDRQLLTPEAAIDVFARLLAGVGAAHAENVWHRDLKPENILISNDLKEVRVGDFGIAHFSESALYSAAETKAAERLANFKYAAPEQRVRMAEKDHRVDIFALGLILNEMITGEIPHGSEYRKIGDVHAPYASLDDLVSRMIRQQADKRPESVAKVMEDFQLTVTPVAAAGSNGNLTSSVVHQDGSATEVAPDGSGASFKVWLRNKREREEVQRKIINSALAVLQEVGPLTPEELVRLSPIDTRELEDMGLITFSQGRWSFRKMLS